MIHIVLARNAVKMIDDIISPLKLILMIFSEIILLTLRWI